MKIINCLLILILCCCLKASNAMGDSAYLYAPWRDMYSPSKLDTHESHICPMCRISNQNAEAQDFVLLQTKHFAVVLNAFPYSRGHLLLIPRAHVKNIQDLSANIRFELIELIADVTAVVQKICNCSGLNVGYNQGYNSGASIPDHLHIHIVPRYENQTDAFISTIGNTRVVSWDLSQLYHKILPHFADLQKKYC